jgi:hypothetical protein
MFLEHIAILQAHHTTQPHVAGLAIGQAQLRYTACQLLHLAMLDACLMAYILACNRADVSQECLLGLRQLHLDYLLRFPQQSLYDYIARQLAELSHMQSSEPIQPRSASFPIPVRLA